MIAFDILVYLSKRFDNFICFGYGRLHALMWFDWHVKLSRKASAKIHPSTQLVAQYSKITVEDSSAKIGI